MSDENNGVPAGKDALSSISEKCEQYWNEPNICDAEVHAILEFIHSQVRVAASETAALRTERDEANPQRNKWAMICRTFDITDYKSACVADIQNKVAAVLTELACIREERRELEREIKELRKVDSDGEI